MAKTKTESKPEISVDTREADELDILRRVRAGLRRKDAEEAHARQKAHDAALAAAAIAK